MSANGPGGLGSEEAAEGALGRARARRRPARGQARARLASSPMSSRLGERRHDGQARD